MLRFESRSTQARWCAWWVIAALFFASCSHDADVSTELAASGKSQTPQGPTAVASSVARSPKKAEDAAGSARRSSEDKNGTWESEDFNSAISRQLHVIGDFITEQNKLGGAQLAGIASSDFHSSRLRPHPLEEVYRDTAFSVRRPSDAPAETDKFSGATKLPDALLEIREWLEETVDRHYKFKTFRVKLDEDQATTTSIFQLAGTSQKKAIHQKSTWVCRWRRQKGGDPLLESIEVTDYEETEGQLNAGPMFADCTLSALGSTERATSNTYCAGSTIGWVGSKSDLVSPSRD